MDLSRLVSLLLKAPTIVPDVLAAVDGSVPPELRPDWDVLKAKALEETTQEKARLAIVGGLTGALQTILAGHGEVGPSHAHHA